MFLYYHMQGKYYITIVTLLSEKPDKIDIIVSAWIQVECFYLTDTEAFLVSTLCVIAFFQSAQITFGINVIILFHILFWS